MDKYAQQKKHLATQKQLRVWVNPEKYEKFKAAVEADGKSIYSVINDYIEDYLANRQAED